MYYDDVTIKFGNEIYYPDTFDLEFNLDGFAELKISTRLSPSNLASIESNMASIEKLSITNVIFSPPATIVFWSDKTKTVVKCDPKEEYDPEKGLAMAISKKTIGDNKGNYYNVFLHWNKKYEKQSKERYESYVEYLFKNILNIGGDLEDD